MGWIYKLFADFFMALGALVFFGALIVILFLDGSVSNVSTGWLFLPPMAFAWLRGEFYHWPKEKETP
jgi:hypothetical protein|tara:strand:+ start:250 stop:450 length:201 start_codon:yes stop_codon:yes gene_type:complete